jgi:GH15 family glucan-1,4-alpha-glucosidase
MLKPSANFTVAVLDRIRALEDFFANNLSPQGLAPPDYSIWEESSDPHTGAPLPTAYFTFTQSMANAGVWSAAQMENTLFLDPSKSSKMQHVADTISKAVESNLWLESGGSFWAVTQSSYGCRN